MSDQPEVESKGGTIRAQAKFDIDLFRNRIDHAPPGFRIPKPAALAASVLISLKSPQIAHELLVTGKDVLHEYLQRNQSESITILDGKVSVTMKGGSDVNKAIELFKKAKES
jgi:hypothetical protein